MKAHQGLQVFDNFIPDAECQALLTSISHYREHHDLPFIVRPERKRSLRYYVINGEEIATNLSAIQTLYARTLRLVHETMTQQVVPLQNKKVGLNVNITPPGGAYRWHYDRNAVTAVLYLNQVDGGEIEAYMDYRVLLSGSRSSRLQGYLDRLMQADLCLAAFGNLKTIPPQPGLLVVMRGDRCLHSVRTVCGSHDRICIVMSFDAPQADFPQAAALDKYLYSTQAASNRSDPNYSPR